MKTDALTFDAARRAIADAIRPIAETESVRLPASLGRILAADVVSDVDVPAYDNAAMDGYAMRSGNHASLRIVGESRAGHPFIGAVPCDGCVRILTGAVVPAGCDAVVPQEAVVVEGPNVRLASTVEPGQHRRRAGEDLRRGSIALRRGRRVGPAEIGVAASIGVDHLVVVRRPRIAVFSSGDELRDIGEPLEAGRIRDANRYTIMAMVERSGAEAIDLGIVRDEPGALEAALEWACGDEIRADAVVTSGGVSVGDADYMRVAMARMGQIDFWSIAIKPGRPMAFGRLAIGGRAAPFFGLPGNPVAVIVVFQALVRHALVALAGSEPEPVLSLVARCDAPLAKAAGRTEFVRGVASRVAGIWHVHASGDQGSAQLHSMTTANCLIVLEAARGPVSAGEDVDVWPFQSIF